MSALDSVATYTAKYELTGANSPNDYRDYIPSRTIKWHGHQTETLSLEKVLTKCTGDLRAEAAKSYTCRLLDLVNFGIHDGLDSTQVKVTNVLQKLSEDIEKIVLDVVVAEKLAEILMGTEYHRCLITVSILDSKPRDDAEDDSTEWPKRATVLWTCTQSGANEPTQINQQNMEWEFGFVLTKETDEISGKETDEISGRIAFDLEVVEEPSKARVY